VTSDHDYTDETQHHYCSRCSDLKKLN